MSKVKFTLYWKSGEDLTLTSTKEGKDCEVIKKKTVIETKEQMKRRRCMETVEPVKLNNTPYQ